MTNALTPIEVTRDEEIAFTRDDEVELHALLDSLEDGEEVTAEWRDENGSMTITCPVGHSDEEIAAAQRYRARHLAAIQHVRNPSKFGGAA